jgi:hypothetical protein
MYKFIEIISFFGWFWFNCLMFPTLLIYSRNVIIAIFSIKAVHFVDTREYYFFHFLEGLL